MQTNKTIGITRTNLPTARASLGSHIRINLLDNLSPHLCLVRDKLLQLKEAPTIEPPIQSFSFSVFVSALPNAFEVFQDNHISSINYFFVDVMIDVTHKSFLSARNCFEQSLGGLRAFALKFSPQIPILYNPCLMSFEYLAIRSDSEVVYSDINTNDTRFACHDVINVNVFRESDVQEVSGFAILNQICGLIIPRKIFSVIRSNIDRNINPAFIDCKPDRIRLESKCSSVIPDRHRLKDNPFVSFVFARVKGFISTSNSVYDKLRLQAKSFSHIIINKFVQFKLMSGLM